ncbi:hypothetical protein ACIRF8_10210 [Streptomyces sp. NPDC102406]|uniref:hypothetical protein n=1 Tax=Streptomyces sp. NPDC102406 TaxID=3366171 RepID=UPI003818950C
MKRTPHHDDPGGLFLSQREIGRLLAETAARNLARTGRRPSTPGTTAPRSR